MKGDTMAGPAVAGILLTGGASRRMGTDKARLLIDGRRCAVRVATALSAIADPVIEVGPGHTWLPQVVETAPGTGPLPAIAAGGQHLFNGGWPGPVLVLACDLPLVTPALLSLIAEWPGDRSVVPVVSGRRQPLLARWARADLETAALLAQRGQRSLQDVLVAPTLLAESAWRVVASARAFADVDTPADLVRLGLRAGSHRLSSDR